MLRERQVIAAGWIRNLQWNDFRARRDPLILRVVKRERAGGNDAGRRGAVAVLILGIVVVVVEIPTFGVVDIAVAVVVLTIACDFAWAGPDFPRQVRLACIDS